jgi:hypothetical protein
MVVGACCCESLWLGGCMGERRKRNVEETNDEASVGLLVPWCVDCEPDHGLPSLCAAFSTLSNWPGRRCRGWAVLCGWWAAFDPCFKKKHEKSERALVVMVGGGRWRAEELVCTPATAWQEPHKAFTCPALQAYASKHVVSPVCGVWGEHNTNAPSCFFPSTASVNDSSSRMMMMMKRQGQGAFLCVGLVPS